MRNKFEFGELNPNIIARTGQQLDPQRFSAYHVQQKVIENYLLPTGFKDIQGPLRGVVLRIETPSTENPFGSYSGLQETTKQPLVRIKVRIPELHPLPEPDTYGPEGDDGVISLYPTFVAINSELPTPAVGEVVYVDYGDRENLEDPKYFGLVFSKPIFGGINIVKETKNIANMFNSAANKLSDFLSPPTNTGENPIPLQPDDNAQSLSDDILNLVNSLWQNDPKWGDKDLGFGDFSIGAAGCLLTALTMCANTLNKKNLTPGIANQMVKNNRGFDGSNIIITKAATALNIQAPVDKKVVNGTISQMKSVLDSTLENGGLAIMHVDYTGDTQGDHFILIHSRQNGGYKASDPALGTTIQLSENLTGDANWGKQNLKKYKPIAIIPVFKV